MTATSWSVVEDDGMVLTINWRRPRSRTIAGRAGQVEVDFRLVGVGIVAGLRVADIRAAPDGNLFELIPFTGAAFAGCAQARLWSSSASGGDVAAERLESSFADRVQG